MKLLQVQHVESGEEDAKDGFGVTPAVLSRAGAMASLGMIQSLYGEGWEEIWLMTWENLWWSEYTLYRVALDELGLFDVLHNAIPDVQMVCYSVWWEGDLPWNAERAMGGVCERGEERCLFSVVQSTAGVGVDTVAKQLAAYVV